MTNLFETEEYKVYLKDQLEDTCADSYDYKYLPYVESKLPKLDYENFKILDVGSRKFDSWDYFREKYNNDIVGIDIGAEGLAYCKAHSKTGMMNVDAHRMSECFDLESYDMIISFHAFEHMYDLPLVVKNCFDLLKPGGYLVFALPVPSFNLKRGHWYDIPDQSAMLQICSNAGFNEVCYNELIDDYRFRPEQEMIGIVKKST